MSHTPRAHAAALATRNISGCSPHAAPEPGRHPAFAQHWSRIAAGGFSQILLIGFTSLATNFAPPSVLQQPEHGVQLRERLAPSGSAGFGMADGSLSSNQFGEGDIAKGSSGAELAESDLIAADAHVAGCAEFLSFFKKTA